MAENPPKNTGDIYIYRYTSWIHTGVLKDHDFPTVFVKGLEGPQSMDLICMDMSRISSWNDVDRACQVQKLSTKTGCLIGISIIGYSKPYGKG